MLLLRGATFPAMTFRFSQNGFNTCSSCEEQLEVKEGTRINSVSIHAPLARSNLRWCPLPPAGRFQYMLLLRGATRRGGRKQSRGGSFNTCSSCEEQHQRGNHQRRVPVSIHAPLARSNPPRLKRGKKKEFQYMLLLRGATVRHACGGIFEQFQYMLLLRGATSCKLKTCVL